MAKKKAKPAAAPADPWTSMFDLPDQKEDKAPEVAAKTEPVDVGQLMRRLDLLEQDNRSLRDSALRPAPKAETQLPAIPDLSLDGMPDPSVDANAYAKELAKRIETRAALQREADKRTSDAEAAKGQRANNLWETFQELHPDIAADPKRVKFIAAEVVNQARTRGLDADAYMANPTIFIKDVVEEYNKVFGEEDEADGEPDIDDNGRTAGVLGGQESGGKPSSGRTDPRTDTRPDMFEDLKVMQKKSGYF